jgi:copper(I)-binding protein
MMRQTCRALLVLVTVGLALPHADAGERAFEAGEITVERAWARATPTGAKVAAGYLTMRNGGAEDRLVSATAEIAARVAIHEMRMEDGMMRMRELPDGVSLPAGGTVALAPSGIHLMFVELKRPLKEGESFVGTLCFAGAGTVDVVFEVQGLGAAAPGAAEHRHH